jgi:membrane protease YdiL (CAAX protease family)
MSEPRGVAWLLDRLLLTPWRDLEAESEQLRAQRTGFDYRPLIALSLGAVCLTLMDYYGVTPYFVRLLGRDGLLHGAADALRDSVFYEVQTLDGYRPGLIQWAWWSAWRFLGYFVLPALCVKLVFREKLGDYGLTTARFSEHAWIYGLCYAVGLGCVAFASTQPQFLKYYPMYKSAYRSWADFLGWEVLYFVQFFSLEFFFRGFLLNACKSRFGAHGIFVAAVPYCMIHFGKPAIEAIGAILAGIALGTLSLRTRSILSGFLIHISVAITMDTAAILRGHGLPTSFWPQ